MKAIHIISGIWQLAASAICPKGASDGANEPENTAHGD